MASRVTGKPGGYRCGPGHRMSKVIRRSYRLVRSRRWRHNAHLWPYVRVKRSSAGQIKSVRVFGHDIVITPIQDVVYCYGQSLHIILSGPSVQSIDYQKLPRLCAMGVNGSIALQERYPIVFDYYCIIDRSFARDHPGVIKKVISEPSRTLFLSVDVLRYMLEYLHPQEIHCQLCIIEDITQRAGMPSLAPTDLGRLTRAGADIAIFDDTVPLGFSFDPTLGWFDADTVAYTALQAAVWLGARNIYFHGLDIKGASNAPRFYETAGAKRPSTRLEQSFPTLIRPSFGGAIPALAQRGVHVYNLSSVSALTPNIIPFVDQAQLY